MRTKEIPIARRWGCRKARSRLREELPHERRAERKAGKTKKWERKMKRPATEERKG